MKLTPNFKGQKCTFRLIFFCCKIFFDVKYVQLKMFNFLVFDCIFANALKNILLSHNLTHHHAQLNESVQIWLDLSKK